MERATAEPSVSGIPGKKASTWSDHHRSFAARSTYVYDFVWDVTADAVGPFCTDADGNVLLDFTSHVGAAPFGYNNPLITEKLNEFVAVDPAKIAGQDFYLSGGWPPSEPEFPGPTQLMERLVETTERYGMDTVFLSNSGAESVENAIKISYAQRGHRGITFEGGFHGRTLGALSLNRSKRNHRKGYPEIPGIISVPYCSCVDTCRCGWKTNGPGGNAIADRLHPEYGNLNSSEVSFIIIEPVQGEGGYRIPNTEFTRGISEICKEYDITLIADEIQSGLGRTGRMWASDHFEFEPDIITSAKALRVGATISRRDVFPNERGRISSTWGAGDFLSSLRGVLTIDTILENGILTNVKQRGRQFRELLRDESLSGVIDVRGIGLMIAVEFATKEYRDVVVMEAFKRGLLIIGCGNKSVRFLPPLDVTEREISIAVDLFSDAATETTIPR